jgi:hypothetical protein
MIARDLPGSCSKPGVMERLRLCIEPPSDLATAKLNGSSCSSAAGMFSIRVYSCPFAVTIPIYYGRFRFTRR